MPLEIEAGCLLYSFAAVLETEPSVLIEELGHDGMEVVWPDLKKPYCYKGFHIQEMIDLCMHRGYSCTEVQAMPTSLPPPSAYMHLMAHNIGPHICYSMSKIKPRFKTYLMGNEGVLYGQTGRGMSHAWAWDGEFAHDPRSGYGASPLSDLKILNAWLLRSNQK
jgi:hypothetical protein